MAGHLGAAVAAGYFFGEQRAELPDAVYRGVEGELDRILRGDEAIWYNVRKLNLPVAELFQPLPEESPAPGQIGQLAKQLQRNIGQLRQSGHNVIFTAIALRGLRDHEELATPAALAGIQKLIAQFDRAPGGRGYYGKPVGWRKADQVPAEELPEIPAYRDLAHLVEATLNELVETAAIRRQGFGGLWHLINHAAGLVELARMGYRGLATQGLAAHRDHLRLWRSLPNVADELGTPSKAAHDPHAANYWQLPDLKRDDARLTHRVKTLYGFSVLLDELDPQRHADLRHKASDALAYLMA